MSDLTHIGYPGGPSFCGIEGPYHGYDPSVSIIPEDFVDDNGVTKPEWCPKCRDSYLDECFAKSDENELFKMGLLPMSEHLRMQANGSSDPEPAERVGAMTAYLVKRLAHWWPGRPQRQKLDDAVRTVIIESIRECRDFESGRGWR